MAKPDPKDFMCIGLKDAKIVKRDLQGQSFLIEDCSSCDIRLLDHTSQVQIDNCVDCTFVVGPVGGSIFLRDCQRCTFFICGQQLRTRDCVDITLLTLLVTQPIIEQTKDCRVGPWKALYPNAKNHLTASGIQPDDTVWEKVYDFSPQWEANRVHWTRIEPSEAEAIEQKFLPSEAEAIEQKCLPSEAIEQKSDTRLFHLVWGKTKSAQMNKITHLLQVDKALCLVGMDSSIMRTADVAQELIDTGAKITRIYTTMFRGKPRLEITTAR